MRDNPNLYNVQGYFENFYFYHYFFRRMKWDIELGEQSFMTNSAGSKIILKMQIYDQDFFSSDVTFIICFSFSLTCYFI